MVQLLCYTTQIKMDTWDHAIEGQHLEEWEESKEIALPPIDSWARQIVPIEYIPPPPPNAFSEANFVESLQLFRRRKMSQDVLAMAKGSLVQRRNSAKLKLMESPRRHTQPGDMPLESSRFFDRAIMGWNSTRCDAFVSYKRPKEP
jgi:hypothetical protein